MAIQILPYTAQNGQPKTKQLNTVARLFWLVTAAVALIALGSFSLSFLALKELATTNGVPASLGWIWPLIVDVSVIVFTAAILVSQLQGRGAKLAIALTVFYAIVTLTGNVLHAPPTWLGWFVAMLPPLSLIAGTEMLRAMAHHNIRQSNTVNTLQELIAQCNTKAQELDRLTRNIEALKVQQDTLKIKENQGNVTPNVNTLNAAKQDAKQERVTALVTFLSDHPQATLTEAAQVVNITRQTASRYITELTEAGTLHRNGNGWEVTQ